MVSFWAFIPLSPLLNAITGLHLAVLVLSSILDRTFVRRSGADSNSIGISFVANLLAFPAWFVYFQLVTISYHRNSPVHSERAVLVFLFVFLIQAGVKFLVVRLLSRKRIDFLWILAGNAYGIIWGFAIRLLVVQIDRLIPRLGHDLISYTSSVTLLAYVIFGGMFVAVAFSFVVCSRSNSDSTAGHPELGEESVEESGRGS